jgi:hypothetical protein
MTRSLWLGFGGIDIHNVIRSRGIRWVPGPTKITRTIAGRDGRMEIPSACSDEYQKLLLRFLRDSSSQGPAV